MAAKKTLNAKNLEALGAPRLAELLIELATGNAAAKRKLRLELAAEASPSELARELRKRLVSIGKARSYIDWQQRKPLIAELDSQRRAIVKLAAADPRGALDLLWWFLGIASPVLARTDDSNGAISDVFAAAIEDLGRVAPAARPQPEALAETVFRALRDNDHGQYDGLIEALAPVLSAAGLARLKHCFGAWSREPLRRGADASDRDGVVRLALQAIAEAEGDVDGYIAQYPGKARTVPWIAADIARRLLAAGRIEEAWAAVEQANIEPPEIDALNARGGLDERTIQALAEDRSSWTSLEWEEARLAVMEAMGRHDAAQAFRWACFARTLEPGHLKAYLKRLPDFDDLEAEARALAHAMAFPQLHRALDFLIGWRALDKAAAMLVARRAELDGDRYEILTPAAAALAEKQPLAASLCLRAMIDFSLAQGRSSRYGHAARHLATVAALATTIGAFGEVETHAAYRARLERQHGRKYGFWSLVE